MEYTDYDEMLNDVKKYAEENIDNVNIEINDDPMNLMMGYKDIISGTRWQIKLTDLKKYLISCSDDKRNFLKKAFTSSEGKQALLDSYLKKIGMVNNNE